MLSKYVFFNYGKLKKIMSRNESKFYVINFINPRITFLKKEILTPRAMKTHRFRNRIKKVSGKEGNVCKGDRKIAPRKIAPQQIPQWVRVWVRVRIGGNLSGRNLPGGYCPSTMRKNYKLIRTTLLLIFRYIYFS